MTKIRVNCFSISLDGYGAGPKQDTTDPLGVGGEALHDWMIATRNWQRTHDGEGGTTGDDDEFASRFGALELTRQAAGDRDIQIAGGASTIRQFLAEGLIDELHIAISPVLLGDGESLFRDLNLLKMGYSCTRQIATAKATHVILTKSA
jgi:hypothetical protein